MFRTDESVQSFIVALEMIGMRFAVKSRQENDGGLPCNLSSWEYYGWSTAWGTCLDCRHTHRDLSICFDALFSWTIYSSLYCIPALSFSFFG